MKVHPSSRGVALPTDLCRGPWLAALVETPLNRVRRRAAGRYGAISWGEARHLGMSQEAIQRAYRSGHLRRLHRGVYVVAGIPSSWEQRLMAARLYVGKGSVICGRSAAALWGFDGFQAGPVEVGTPHRSKARATDLRIRRLGKLHEEDVTTHRGLPVTTPARTLVDLAGLVRPDLLEEAFESAVRDELTTPEQVGAALSRTGSRGRRGAGVLCRLVESTARDEGSTRSRLETRLARLIRRSHLPTPVRQFECREEGVLIAVADFAYPELKIAIEADGFRWHSARKAWQRDVSRSNALVARGWIVLRFTWDDVHSRPGYVIAEITRAIASRTPGDPAAAPQ